MKEYIDLLIEDKWRKQDGFFVFIAAIENITSPKQRNITLYQGNYFINVYKTFFDKHYTRCLKEILPLSI